MQSPTYETLKQYCYFARLSDESLQSLASKLQVGEAPSGTEIIREGENADSFYLVCNGEVEVSKRTGLGGKSILSIIGAGTGIGEMGLLTSTQRTATVTAITDITYYKLNKEDFNEVVRNDSALYNMLKEKSKGLENANKFRSLQPFALLPPEKMAAITSKLVERTCTQGEDIITQGEKGDKYFIIKSGSADVHKLIFETEPEKVATLKKGEGFGEEALITDSLRNATVKAAEETVVWSLSKNDFDTIMKTSFLHEVFPEDMPKDNSAGYSLLDVRMDIEFDDEHIPEALNIPLDELRKRYSELDADKEYYVYCIGGARSASATFLLQSQGFKAMSIKGGLSAWEGPLTGSGSGIHPPEAPT